MEINFRNFILPINEPIILIAFAIIGVSYYLLFAEHHKRNKMQFGEIYPLVINYFVLSLISIFIFFFGIDCVLTGYVYNDEIAEVIKELILGFTIIILVILNFIFYTKKHKIDLIQEEREAKEEKTAKIAEWIQLIIFLLLIIVPIFNIFKYINFIDKMIKYKQIVSSLICIISAIVLMYNLNPLDIRNKIKLLFYKTKKEK